MSIATVTSKGQVTIPKDVREEFGIAQGTRLMFVRTQWGLMLKPATNSVSDLAGSVAYDGPPVSVEEIDEAIASAVAEDDQRISREWRAGATGA